MRFIVIILIWFLIDIYCFQAIKTISVGSNNYFTIAAKWIYWLFDLFLLSVIIYLYFTDKIAKGPSKEISIYFGLLVLSVAPKLILTPFLLIEDISRLIINSINWISTFNSKNNSIHFFTGRRKIISQIGLGIASIPLLGIVYGLIKGKYEYRVHKVKLSFKDLPEEFHGFKITQLSDIHSGSFDSKKDVQKGIDIANEQKSDIIFFTGDLVNNSADEMDNWIDTFSQLNAPHGKFSILGNHDYGDYKKWDSDKEKENNLIRLKEVHSEIGFNLLLNENVKIEKDGASISLLGVENWGLRGFHQYGDLDKTIENIHNDDFKILLSHDPSHWEAQVLKHEKHVHLTLSGHTHGMQFGIEIPGFKWSPIKYIYPQWAGAYEKNNKYIYVNRGFGFLGFPGRVGILPEITVIELLKG